VKKIFILHVLVFIGTACFSQTHFYTSFFAGVTNYRGDLGRASPAANANAVAGIGAVIEITPRILVRGEMNYGKVSGTDKYDGKTRNRNLSFSSKITEFSLLFEYILFNLYDYKVSPYFFAGIGTFKFSPYTKNKNGNQVFLAEQSTEGQGFYPGRELYRLNEICFPFGGGVQWALSHNKRITLEAGLRKTATDYLDDVSTTYIDRAVLEQNRGATAVSLAYRGAELANAPPYPADGSRRGNPKNDDWYIFTGLSFRISIQPKTRYYRYRYKPKKAGTSCPVVF
jgi:hypothetical protein